MAIEPVEQCFFCRAEQGTWMFTGDHRVWERLWRRGTGLLPQRHASLCFSKNAVLANLCHLDSAHGPPICTLVLWSPEVHIELPALRTHQQHNHEGNKNSSQHMVNAELEWVGISPQALLTQRQPLKEKIQ